MTDSLLVQLHLKFILKLHQGLTKDTFEYWVTEHLRVSGSYWALMALSILDGTKQPEFNWDEIIDWVFAVNLMFRLNHASTKMVPLVGK